ncbi:hypothetical protein RND81_13G145200 [Saponaria officinalis]|uniref:Uncharacterized protein n=1 Tax=Saponaria officinalis TaxID=3572 RepID=A0AAW1H0N6_SAPOF
MGFVSLPPRGSTHTAEQVCYATYPSTKKDNQWSAVFKIKARSHFDVPVDELVFPEDVINDHPLPPVFEIENLEEDEQVLIEEEPEELEHVEEEKVEEEEEEEDEEDEYETEEDADEEEDEAELFCSNSDTEASNDDDTCSD